MTIGNPAAESCGHDGLKAASGLQGDQLDVLPRELQDEVIHAGYRAANDEACAAGTDSDIQLVLRDIDANNPFHADPSLHDRARLAVPATVRVRWKRGGAPS